MPINYNLLNAIQPGQVIAQLPAAGGGEEDGIGSLAEGLSGLVGGFKGMMNKGPEISNPASAGTAAPIQGLQSQQPGGYQSPQQAVSQTISHQTQASQLSPFQEAMQKQGMKEGDPALTAYLQKANPNLDPGKTPWCAGFVGSVMNASGLKGTGSLSARSYLNYGTSVKQPSIGDIVVLNTMNDPNRGHVGFYAGTDDQGRIKVLGGNQDNSVSTKTFSQDIVLGYRHPPSGSEVQQFAKQNNIQNPQQLAQLTTPQAQAQVSQQSAMQQATQPTLQIGSDKPFQAPQPTAQVNPQSVDFFKQREAQDPGYAAFVQQKRAELSQQHAQQGLPMSQSPNGTLKNPELATNTIKQYEGLESYKDGFSHARWDVNAYRVGHGSDTYTTADGKIHPVKADTKITAEDANRDLQRRSQEFAQTASKQAGAVWNQLPDSAQAALTSVAYNYGSLPKRILPAVKSGDLSQIATAVKDLGSDNKGINKQRRAQEAAMILGGSREINPLSGAKISLNDDQPLIPRPQRLPGDSHIPNPKAPPQASMAALAQPLNGPGQATPDQLNSQGTGVNFGLLQALTNQANNRG